MRLDSTGLRPSPGQLSRGGHQQGGTRIQQRHYGPNNHSYSREPGVKLPFPYQRDQPQRENALANFLRSGESRIICSLYAVIRKLH